MRQMRTAAVVLGALLAVPVLGFGAPSTALQTKATKAAKAKSTSSGTHSIRGVVKSVDTNTLVIERGTGNKKSDMTFAMDATTHRTGEISVGSTVAVRYKTEASKVMALDVQPVKQRPVARKTAAH